MSHMLIDKWLISRFETDFDPKSIILRWIDCNMTHFNYSLCYFSDKNGWIHRKFTGREFEARVFQGSSQKLPWWLIWWNVHFRKTVQWILDFFRKMFHFDDVLMRQSSQIFMHLMMYPPILSKKDNINPLISPNWPWLGLTLFSYRHVSVPLGTLAVSIFGGRRIEFWIDGGAWWRSRRRM